MAVALAYELPFRGLRSASRGEAIVRELRARALRRHPFLANLTVLPCVLGALSLVALVQIVPTLVQPFGDEVRHEIEESDARKNGTALLDSHERWIGAFPGRLDSDLRYNHSDAVKLADTDLSGSSFPVYPDHKVLFVERPPKEYLACLKRLEDRYIGHWLINPHGVDGLGILRIPLSGMRSGGSGLSSQLVQQLIRPKGSDETRLLVMRRKAEEILWTAPLMYGAAPNDMRFDQLVSRHLPHVQYTQQDRSVLWGIEASSRVLFNTAADDSLPKAAQYILAGSIRRPLVFAVARNHKTGELIDRTTVASENWHRAIARAQVCADDRLLNPDAKERERLKHELETLALELPEPKADPVIEALGHERYGNHWPERARDPFRRANIFAYNAMQGLVAEFRDALGKSWSRQVSSVSMTIDIVDERRFSPKFRAAARQWLSDRPDLNAFYRPWASYSPGQPEPTAAIPDILAVVTDEHGKIVRYYSSREGAPFYGLKRDQDGRYQPKLEDQPLASLGKIGNALVLIQNNNLSPDTILAFAHSNSDAVTAATELADPDGSISRKLLESLLWTSNAAKDYAGHDLDPRWSMSHGLVAASGRTILWNSLAITNALSDNYEPVPPPSLIKQVTLVDLKAEKALPATQGLPSAYALSGLVQTLDPASLVRRADQGKARQLLSAPVCKGGTLRHLAAWCGTRAHFVWAKTATTDSTARWNSGNNTFATGVVDRLAIAGGIEFPDGRRFALYLSIGGHDPAHPLMIGKPGQREAEAAQIAPLYDLMLSDLEQKPEGRTP